MPPPTDPGQLDQRATVQKLDDPPTITLAGEQAENWTDVATRWAKVEPLSGRELVRAQAMAADATSVVWLRYDEALGLGAKCRLVITTLNDKVLHITGTPQIWGRKVWFECLCTEPQAQAVS